MKCGYIRISDFTPRKEVQMKLLTQNQVDAIYSDLERTDLKDSELNKLINYLKDGDALYVYSMICLSPNTDEFKKIIALLKKRNIHLYFLKEDINSKKDNIISNLNAFEEYLKISNAEEKSNFLKKRQKDGEEIGRPKKEFNQELFEELYQKKKSGLEYNGKRVTVKLMAKLLGIARQTVYDRIKDRESVNEG